MGLLGDRAEVNVWFEHPRRNCFVAYAEAMAAGELLIGRGEANNSRRAKMRALDDLRAKRHEARKKARAGRDA